MTKSAQEKLPNELRMITAEISKAAYYIEKLQDIINRAKAEFFRDGSDSKVMQRMINILNEMP